MVKEINFVVSRDDIHRNGGIKKVIEKYNRETKGLKPRPQIKLIVK